MKIIIQEKVCCDKRNMKKYLPARYASLVNKTYYKQIVTFVCFPIEQTAITSKSVEKVLKKIKNPNVTILYFARCFTLEAINMIEKTNGEAFSIVDFLWTEDRYNRIREGAR